MNRLAFLLLFSGLAQGQVADAPPTPSAMPSAAPSAPANPSDLENARKARAFLDQTIQALGGQAYLTVQTKGEEGRYYSLYHGQSRGTGQQYRTFARFPDRDRFEILARGNVLVPLPLVGVIVVSHDKKNTKDIVVIHNGDKGYETTYKGTAPLDKEELAAYLRRRQHSLDQVLRKWINDPTMAFFYDGVAIVDGKPADKVTVLNSKNDAVSVFLDQYSHLPLKTSFTWRDPADKQKNAEEEIYDNYKPVQGIMTAHSVTRTFNGDMTHQRFINTAKYNMLLPEDLFEATVDYNPLAPMKKR